MADHFGVSRRRRHRRAARGVRQQTSAHAHLNDHRRCADHFVERENVVSNDQVIQNPAFYEKAGFSLNQMRAISLRDKHLIESALRRNTQLHLYELGDLDDFFWDHTTWYADDPPREIVLISQRRKPARPSRPHL